MKFLVNKETCFLKLNINLTVIEQRFGRKLIPPIDPSMNLKTLSMLHECGKNCRTCAIVLINCQFTVILAPQ
jgi:hypothetical protein